MVEESPESYNDLTGHRNTWGEKWGNESTSVQ